jgi:maleate isomerase
MTEIKHIEPILGRGPGYLANVGLITLESDTVLEPDVNYFSQLDGVAVYSNRMPIPDQTDREALLSMQPHIAPACEGFKPLGRLDSVIYGCTAGSVAIGPENVKSEIRKAFPGIPCTTPIGAAMTALKALNCHSVDLLVPYAEDVTQEMVEYFENNGLRVNSAHTFGLRSGLEMGLVEPKSILDAAKQIPNDGADALFISCTAMYVSPVFAEITATQGRPVVSSNQALAWHALRLAGVKETIPNVGPYLRDMIISD